MKTEELIEAARICTTKEECEGCPLFTPDDDVALCVGRLISSLADKLEKIEAMASDIQVYGGCNACKWDRFGCKHPMGEFKYMSYLDAVPGFNCPNWEWRGVNHG